MKKHPRLRSSRKRPRPSMLNSVPPHPKRNVFVPTQAQLEFKLEEAFFVSSTSIKDTLASLQCMIRVLQEHYHVRKLITEEYLDLLLAQKRASTPRTWTLEIHQWYDVLRQLIRPPPATLVQKYMERRALAEHPAAAGHPAADGAPLQPAGGQPAPVAAAGVTEGVGAGAGDAKPLVHGDGVTLWPQMPDAGSGEAVVLAGSAGEAALAASAAVASAAACSSVGVGIGPMPSALVEADLGPLGGALAVGSLALRTSDGRALRLPAHRPLFGVTAALPVGLVAQDGIDHGAASAAHLLPPLPSFLGPVSQPVPASLLAAAAAAGGQLAVSAPSLVLAQAQPSLQLQQPTPVGVAVGGASLVDNASPLSPASGTDEEDAGAEPRHPYARHPHAARGESAEGARHAGGRASSLDGGARSHYVPVVSVADVLTSKFAEAKFDAGAHDVMQECACEFVSMTVHAAELAARQGTDGGARSLQSTHVLQSLRSLGSVHAATASPLWPNPHQPSFSKVASALARRVRAKTREAAARPHSPKGKAR